MAEQVKASVFAASMRGLARIIRSAYGGDGYNPPPLMYANANQVETLVDEWEALAAENARLAEALRKIGDMATRAAEDTGSATYYSIEEECDAVLARRAPAGEQT